LVKVTPEMARVWARIMERLPRARLVLLAGAGGNNDPSISRMFESWGIPRERLEVIGRLPPQEYFRLYHRCDIALDTFPYNGHTTSCDSLWMGVPVVSMAGSTHVSRVGLAFLSALGLDARLAVRTEEDYVATATSLAEDVSALVALRARLRPLFKESPMRDEQAVAARLESKYRELWKRWCARVNTGD
jgi:predicted O-linked N-acetylglucosamine transferase (SPINDLY family)